MDPEMLLHSLPGSSSRRNALRVLGGSVLGGLFTFGAVSTDAKKGGKGKSKGRDKKKRKATVPPVTSPPPSTSPPPDSLSVAYECPGPGPGGFWGINGTDRLAQRFVAGRSGSLRQIRFDIIKDPSSPGDWVVQLVKIVGIGNTKPSNSPLDVLAANTIADASVPDWDSTLIASFAGPTLEKNKEYAAVLSRPGSTTWGMHMQDVDVCGGQPFAGLGGDAFFSAGGPDLVVSVFVE